jgi:hypothetical protein
VLTVLTFDDFGSSNLKESSISMLISAAVRALVMIFDLMVMGVDCDSNCEDLNQVCLKLK